jgi:hypothetical protein
MRVSTQSRAGSLPFVDERRQPASRRHEQASTLTSWPTVNWNHTPGPGEASPILGGGSPLSSASANGSMNINAHATQRLGTKPQHDKPSSRSWSSPDAGPKQPPAHRAPADDADGSLDPREIRIKSASLRFAIPESNKEIVRESARGFQHQISGGSKGTNGDEADGSEASDAHSSMSVANHRSSVQNTNNTNMHDSAHKDKSDVANRPAHSKGRQYMHVTDADWVLGSSSPPQQQMPGSPGNRTTGDAFPGPYLPVLDSPDKDSGGGVMPGWPQQQQHQIFRGKDGPSKSPSLINFSARKLMPPHG